MTGPRIEQLLLQDDGLVPNNPQLALTVYRGALPTSGRAPEAGIMARFADNGWSGAWVNGIYPYHHYHSTTHEVLGIARGSALVQFGGPKGPHVSVTAGDVVLIPAGVGHCRLDASPDLSVVGAYPGGQEPDLKRATAEARLTSLPEIADVPIWPRDPVTGADSSSAP